MRREGKKGIAFFVTSGATELSWLLALTTFSAVSTMGRPFPYGEAIGTFLLAAVLTRISFGRRWRVVYVLVVQAAGLVAGAGGVLHAAYYGSHHFLSAGWVTEFFAASRTPVDWIILLINLFWIILLWSQGVTLARREQEYYTACARFDIGLSAFFVLFLAKLVMQLKGVQPRDASSELFLLPFFLFGLLSIGIARVRTDVAKEFLPGYQGLGMVVSFFAVVVIGVSGIVLFFMPYLALGAEVGWRVIKTVGGPLAPLFLGIVRFMLAPRAARENQPAGADKGPDWNLLGSYKESWWVELIEKVLGWGLAGLLGLAAVIVAGITIFYTVKWLFGRTRGTDTADREPRARFWWIKRLLIFLRDARNRVAGCLKAPSSAEDCFLALSRWARRSGLRHAMTETPSEFGIRVARQFPKLTEEIGEIVEACNAEVYGERRPGKDRIRALRLALRSLRSPVYWPSRFKTLVARPQA
jgi:hypothetical protein